MTGRKKGKQSGSFRSKGERARLMGQTIREGCSAVRPAYKPAPSLRPPRLSLQAQGALRGLICARVLSDQDSGADGQARRTGAPVLPGGIRASGELDEGRRPLPIIRRERRGPPSLVSLCVNQIGRDFLSYDGADPDMREAVSLLPCGVVTAIAAAASRHRRVADSNVRLLCGPGMRSLVLRGPITDEGGATILPEVRGAAAVAATAAAAVAAKVNGAALAAAPLAEPGAAPSDAPAAASPAAAAEAAAAPCGSVDAANEPGTRPGAALTWLPLPAASAASASEGSSSAPALDTWEDAPAVVESVFGGCMSLTDLTLSSPHITEAFVARVADRCPTLRRLALHDCFGTDINPGAVLSSVARLTALREIDVSGCRWFGDATLLRWAHRLCGGGGNASRRSGGYGGAISFCGDDDGGGGGGGSSGGSSAWSTLWDGSSGMADSFGAWMAAAQAAPTAVAAACNGGAGAGDRNGASDKTLLRKLTVTCRNTLVTEAGALAAMRVASELKVVREDAF
ncbi:unnamed protein product [Phaeothamnion confervicola]